MLLCTGWAALRDTHELGYPLYIPADASGVPNPPHTAAIHSDPPPPNRQADEKDEPNAKGYATEDGPGMPYLLGLPDVDPILFAIRETPQASVEYSPFELIYGHQPQSILSILEG